MLFVIGFTHLQNEHANTVTKSKSIKIYVV